jgi:hypothetical protein
MQLGISAVATHREATSIRYRMTAAKLPAIEDQDGFMFDGMPINEGPIGLPPPARISWPAGDLPVLAPRPPAKPGSAIF